MSYILAIICGAGLLALDQYTKHYIASNFVLAQSRDFIPHLIDITYVRNNGGAWGMLGGYTWLLLSLTAVIMLVCIALILKYGLKNKLMFWAMIFILSGGIGNMIDRIFRGGSVVDFLHFAFMPDFPVFNVADCAIVIGAGLLMLYFVIGTVRDESKKRRALEKSFKEETDHENN